MYAKVSFTVEHKDEHARRPRQRRRRPEREEGRVPARRRRRRRSFTRSRSGWSTRTQVEVAVGSVRGHASGHDRRGCAARRRPDRAARPGRAAAATVRARRLRRRRRAGRRRAAAAAARSWSVTIERSGDRPASAGLHGIDTFSGARYEHSSFCDSTADHDADDQLDRHPDRRHLADPAAGRPAAGHLAADGQRPRELRRASDRSRWRS